MDITPINKYRGLNSDSIKPIVSSASPVDNVQKAINDKEQADQGSDSVPHCYRVDESQKRIKISILDPETGEIIKNLSPMDAVIYVRHLNEAIRNMLNEIA